MRGYTARKRSRSAEWSRPARRTWRQQTPSPAPQEGGRGRHAATGGAEVSHRAFETAWVGQGWELVVDEHEQGDER